MSPTAPPPGAGPPPSRPAGAPHRSAYRPPRAADLAQVALRQEGRLWLTVQGQSMLPLLRQGDLLRLVLGRRRLRLGDVIVFEGPADDDLVAHRMVARSGRGLTVCGDNLPAADPPLAADRILGRVDRMERAGLAIDLDRSPWRLIHLALALLIRSRLAVPWALGRRPLWRLQGLLLRAIDRVRHDRIF